MTFPALVPSNRVFIPGEYSNTPWRSMGGRQTQSRHSNVITGQQLKLVFSARDEEDKLLIRNHYFDRQGTFGTFDLPEEVWSGVDDPDVFTPAGYVWRYAARPVVDDVVCGVYDITVDLVMLPDDGPGSIANTQDAVIKPPAVRFLFSALAPQVVVGTVAAAPAVASRFSALVPAVFADKVLSMPAAESTFSALAPAVFADEVLDAPAIESTFTALAPDVLSEGP